MTPIRTLLVANRSEIAVRVMRTARAMGIRTVAVYSDPDRGALHVTASDRAVPLGGSSATESYLDAEKILDAARRAGADAIHPGYGFLSENAAFAEACAAAGITFVGPSPEAIREMGLKHRAKDLARAAGVPVLPDAVLTTDEPKDWTAAGADVGHPLLVKAVAGGGGRGMRLVTDPDALIEAVEGARREAASSFGDGMVFLERYLPAPRHVEVQVFGDTHGHVIHLAERECSVQRRYQKVIEEAPSPAVTPNLRARMGSTAVALARALDYVGAGTVEFLLDGEGDDAPFYFLEMNTRLQVEHPVTEEVTGLDLVRLQLLVAMGEPLPVAQADVTPAGHAIEVRLYAEDPAAGFTPTFGTMSRFAAGDATEPVASDGITSAGVFRIDDGIRSGGEISTFYDPMLAKVIAYAPTRAEAAGRLASGLAGMHLHGPGTNRDFLVAALRDADFLAGATRTDFIDRHPHLVTAAPDADTVLVHLAAAIVTTTQVRRGHSPAASLAPSGWRAFPDSGRWGLWQRPGAEPLRVEYHLTVAGKAGSGCWTAAGPSAAVAHGVVEHLAAAPQEGSVRLAVSGEEHELALAALTAEGVRVALDRVERRCTVHRSPDGTVWVNDPDHQTAWTEVDRLPQPEHAIAAGGTVSAVPGTVVAVLVEAGQSVGAGDGLVVIEAMKMEHRIVAPEAGVVEEVKVAVGDRIDAHQLLVVLT